MKYPKLFDIWWEKYGLMDETWLIKDKASLGALKRVSYRAWKAGRRTGK